MRLQDGDKYRQRRGHGALLTYYIIEVKKRNIVKPGTVSGTPGCMAAPKLMGATVPASNLYNVSTYYYYSQVFVQCSPSLQNSFAVTLPMPVFEPVTMAVFPSSLALLVHLLLNIIFTSRFTYIILYTITSKQYLNIQVSTLFVYTTFIYCMTCKVYHKHNINIINAI